MEAINELVRGYGSLVAGVAMVWAIWQGFRGQAETRGQVAETHRKMAELVDAVKETHRDHERILQGLSAVDKSVGIVGAKLNGFRGH